MQLLIRPEARFFFFFFWFCSIRVGELQAREETMLQIVTIAKGFTSRILLGLSVTRKENTFGWKRRSLTITEYLQGIMALTMLQ